MDNRGHERLLRIHCIILVIQRKLKLCTEPDDFCGQLMDISGRLQACEINVH